MGVCRIPIPEIQAMIACKNCACMVGWFAVGRNVGGWIYSKPVGWLVVLFAAIGRLVGWMVGAWLACRLVFLLSGLSVGRRSVEPSGRLAIQPITHWPAIHPSIWSLTYRPSGLGFDVSRFRPSGWLRWGYLGHACKSLVKFGKYFI